MEVLKDNRKPVPLLDYADFIIVPYGGVAAATAKEGMHRVLFDNLKKPGAMPIHPAIYNQPELYTERFVDKIYQSMPESLQSDIAAASRVFGVDLEIIENKGSLEVLYQGKRFCSISQRELNRDKFEVVSSNLSGKAIGYEHSYSKLSAGVTIEGKPYYTDIFHYPSEETSAFLRRLYTLNREKIEAYKFREAIVGKAAELIVWHTHNTDLLSRLLMIRSFAILFNNLGLEELGLVEKMRG